MPFNNIKCKGMDLKVVGLNLKNIVTPTKQQKFGVTDYAGMIGEDAVFGLGIITEDNYLEIDPDLCWKKPDDWTMEEAATVPLYYFMAYDIIYCQGKFTHRPYYTLLVHAGYTPFAQAVIRVALSLNVKVYTTCFNRTQKDGIINKFPQVSENNVFILDETESYDFIDQILETSEGEGIKILIDGLESNKFRNQTIHCLGDMGSYFLIGNNDMDVEHTFGMNIFLREAAVVGYNPDLIFQMKQNKKLTVSSLIKTGIKTHVVKPLDSYSITEKVTRQQTEQLIRSKFTEDMVKKVVMPVFRTVPERRVSESDTPVKEPAEKKNYMIVGSYNSLWIDLLKWLISRGAECVHVVLNEDEIPQYIRKRFDALMHHHKYVTVTFSRTENLNTAQNCNQFIKKFQNGSSIDYVFYIKPGFEKQMTNIDYALRMHSKSSCLVSIGTQACRVTERRRNDQYPGISFVLLKSSLRNNMIVAVLDNWMKSADETNGVIVVDKPRVADEQHVITKYSDILPLNASELVDIITCAGDKPTFVEFSTQCPPKNFTRELDPIFVFPGFKQMKLEKFASQLLYPTYMAKYPHSMTSLDGLAADYGKWLIQRFDNEMFTLIAEGWAGPLVLKVSEYMEKRGKSSEVILLDGTPGTVKAWPYQTAHSDTIISKYIPSKREGEKVTIDDLKNWSAKMSVAIAKEEETELAAEDIRRGLEMMINRLELIEQFNSTGFKIKSTVHAFTPDNIGNTSQSINDLKKMCEMPCYHHVLEDTECSFLESQSLLKDVCNLALLEYKTAAKKQSVEAIATLDLILDAKYNTEGLHRH